MGNGKNHKSPLSASWNYQSLTSNLIMLYNSVPIFLGSLIPQCIGYVFCRSGENGPGVEGPSRLDRVNGP